MANVKKEDLSPKTGESQKENDELAANRALPSKTTTGGGGDFMDCLKIYYARLFPFSQMVKWLTYRNDPTGIASEGLDPAFLSRREFALSGQNDSVFIRWRGYNTVKEFKDDIFKFCPVKIDIGAVYSMPICRRDTFQGAMQNLFVPKERELVFDIDMTDYDDIRKCCQGAEVCDKCWVFMDVAVSFIHKILTGHFGFKHVLWVFSGRRGIHCWVCDARARCLSYETRSSVVEYINLLTGSAQNARRVNLYHPLHSVEATCDNVVASRYWTTLLADQDFFSSSSPHATAALAYLTKSKEEVERWIKSTPRFTSEEFWNKVTREAANSKNDTSVSAIRLAYSAPRLDVNVSKGMNHLLKAPFCIHPKTGLVCIPFEVKELKDKGCFVSSFRPSEAPSLGSLVSHLGNAAEGEPLDSNCKICESKCVGRAWEEGVKVFRQFLHSLMKEEAVKKAEYHSF